MNWYFKVLKQCTDFSGRARRKEYWMFALFNIILSIVAGVLDILLGTAIDLFGFGILCFLYSISMTLPSLALSVRRLHDIDKSGWMYLIVLIPLIGPIWLLVLMLKESTPGENQYGLNPKEIKDSSIASSEPFQNDGFQKFVKIVAVEIGVISISFLAIIIYSGDEIIRAGGGELFVNNFIFVAYFVLVTTLSIVLVLTLLNLISNLSVFKNTLIGIGAFVVLSLLCYFGFANGVEAPLKDGDMLSANGSKLIGAGLYLFYFLALIAGGIMLGFGIKKMIK